MSSFIAGGRLATYDKYRRLALEKRDEIDCYEVESLPRPLVDGSRDAVPGPNLRPDADASPMAPACRRLSEARAQGRRRHPVHAEAAVGAQGRRAELRRRTVSHAVAGLRAVAFLGLSDVRRGVRGLRGGRLRDLPAPGAVTRSFTDDGERGS